MKTNVGTAGWLVGVGLLLAGCQATEPQIPVVQETVWLKSAALREVSYDYTRQQLALSFPNGSAYTYPGVPEHLYRGLKAAEKPGTYFHRHIRPRYEGILVAGPGRSGAYD